MSFIKRNIIFWGDTKQKSFQKYGLPLLPSNGWQLAWFQPKMFNMVDHTLYVIMGKRALEVLQGEKIYPKGRTVGSLRGEIKHVSNTVALLPTWTPDLIEIDYVRKPEFEWDLQLAKRFAHTGRIMPKLGEYHYVDNFDAVVNEINARYQETGKAVPISADLETLGLDPFSAEAYIISISITVTPGCSDIITFTGDMHQPDSKLLQQIHWIFNTPNAKTRGANFKFDMLWMQVHWGITSFDNFSMDTSVVGSLLDENRSNSLNLHTKVYVPDLGGYDDPFNKNHDKSRMDLALENDPIEFKTYAGGDTDACLQVSTPLTKQLVQDKKLAKFYTRLLHPSIDVFRKMEYRGMLVDAEIYDHLEHEAATEIYNLRMKLSKMYQRKLGNKFADRKMEKRSKDYPEGYIPTVPVVMNEYLFGKKGLHLKPLMVTPKTGAPSAAKEHLEMLDREYDDVPELKTYIETLNALRSVEKVHSTYIVGFRKHIRSDGMFHPSYMMFRGLYEAGDDDSGTVTGRLSAKDPAYQTIPKRGPWANKLRTVFIPPPGYVILNVDYSQGELRICACVANETNMIAAYNAGIDLHTNTAAEVNELTLEEFYQLPKATQKDMRGGGKAGNFGLIYGMQAPGFQDYARKQYGQIWTLDHCEKFRDRFLTVLYPGLPDWHERSKRIAHNFKAVASPLGRIRHLPMIDSSDWSVKSKQERQAINSPVQSTLSDMAQLAMVELDRKYPDLWIFGMTHDSISFYVPEDEYTEWALRIKEVMETLPLHEFGWAPPVEFTTDAELGVSNLGALQELTSACELPEAA